MDKKVCDVCGKEFEPKYEWQKTCWDCYKKKAANAPGKEKTTKKTTSTSTSTTTSSLSTETSDIVAEVKKTYDEVIAQFANDYPEVIGDPATLQALASTVYIEKNKRIRREKF